MSVALEQLIDADAAEGSPVSNALRATLIDQLRADGFPHFKVEQWKYTGLRSLEGQQFKPASIDAAWVEAELNRVFGDDWPGQRLVFAGGCLVEAFSSSVGLTLESLPAKALAEKLALELSGPADAFARLCLVRAQEAWRVSVQSDAVAQPIHVVFLSADQNAAAEHLFLSLEAAPGQRIQWLEYHAKSSAGLSNIWTHIALTEGSHCHHGRVLDCGEEHNVFARTQLELSDRAEYHHGDVVLNGRLLRHEGRITYRGEAAQASMAAAAVVDGRSHIDEDWRMVHAANDCVTRQFFRAAAAGRSRAIYSGSAVIEANVAGSEVEQSSRGLMLSADAEIDARPVLEIYADEVQASHGATVGQLDDDILFYLRSRGIEEEMARRMLIASFIQSAFSSSPASEVFSQLRLALDQSRLGWV